MNIIFQIDGGIGKSIAATAVCKAVKAQYPTDKLIVITGYPGVFLCNAHVDKVLSFGDLNYFYQDNIEGQDIKMMLHNPYLETSFIKGDTHLVKVWCEMFGIAPTVKVPELSINNREQTFFGRQFNTPKPILLIQTNGGGKDQPNKYSWTRDLPQVTAQKVVNTFANDYTILHIRREDQLPLQGVTAITNLDFRALAVLISMSTKRLLIDSFAQHTAAAFGLPSVVCMINQTVVNQFGYDLHTNIIANPPTNRPELRHSVFSRYNISGNPTEFPYNNEDEIYNADKIIEALRSVGKGQEQEAGADEKNRGRRQEAVVDEKNRGRRQEQETEIKAIAEEAKQENKQNGNKPPNGRKRGVLAK